MALWGNEDGTDITETATIAGGSKDTITFGDDVSSFGIEAGDTIVFDRNSNSRQHLRVKSVNSTTQFTLMEEATAGNNKNCELLKSPKYTALADVTAKSIIGADVSETQAASPGSITHAGWIKKTTRTRQPGNVSATYFETLVASGSITQDTQKQDLS